MKNKNIFKVEALNLEKFAHSLGLAVVPRVRFLKGKIANRSQTMENDNTKLLENSWKESDSGTDDEDNCNESLKKSMLSSDDDDDDDDDILTIKRRDHEIAVEPINVQNNEQNIKKQKLVTKASVVKKMLKKNIIPNKKVIFNEQGETIIDNFKDKLSKEGKEYDMENESGINIEKARMVLKAEDRFDKKLFREKVREKHKTKKMKMKQDSKQNNEEELKDDFGTDSESSELDTSWIPDPDKFYGNKTYNTDTEDSETG